MCFLNIEESLIGCLKMSQYLVDCVLIASDNNEARNHDYELIISTHELVDVRKIFHQYFHLLCQCLQAFYYTTLCFMHMNMNEEDSFIYSGVVSILASIEVR